MKKVILSILCCSILDLSAQTYNPNDSLNLSKEIPLEEIVITATKVNESTPVAYSELDKSKLRQLNNGQGIPSLIQQTPSVITSSDAGTGIGYSGFRIRGTDANRINITVNGVPMNDSESHTVFWVNLPDFASSVNSIQIQRGVGTSTNGAAAFGATVAMQTQKAELKPSAEYSISAGSFGTIKNMVKIGTGLLGEHFVIDARYSNIQSDGYIDRASADMHSYFASASYYGDQTLIRLQTFGSIEKTYQAWGGVPSYLLNSNRTYNPCGIYEENGEVRYYDNQTDNYRQQHYHLTFSHRLSQQLSINATLHYTHGIGYYEDYKEDMTPGDYKLPSYTNGTINQTDLIRRKWLKNDFYGAIISTNYRNDHLQLSTGVAINRYDGDHFGRVIWSKHANCLPQPDYEYYRNNGDKLNYNIYIKTSYLITPHLNSFIDLQYRGIRYAILGSDDVGGDNVDILQHWHFFNPKIGLNYQRNNHKTFISFSVANREPNRDNFIEAGLNERPTHETLYDYEAGYQYSKKLFHIGANLYLMDYNNQLILTGKISEIGEPLTSNIKDSYRMGLELTGGIQITPWLEWNGNLTWSRNKIKRFTESIEVYDKDWNFLGEEQRDLGTTDIAFSPQLIGNSIFHFTWKQFNVGLNTQFVSRQYIDNTSSKERSIAPYCVSNLFIGYVIRPRFIKEITLDFTLYNLFNKQYETNAWVYSAIVDGKRYKEDGYFTQAGTHVMARATFKF